MEDKKFSLRRLEWILALLVVGFAIGFIPGYRMASKSTEAEIVRDTVTKVVTLWRDFPEPQKTVNLGYLPVPAYRFITDTLTSETVTFCHDTTVKYVYLPREQKYYSEADGKLRLWISGYEPRLDRWEADFQETTITETYKPPAKRWGIGIAAGYGISVVDGRLRPAPNVSVVLSYNFVTW